MENKILYVTPVLLFPAAGGPALRVESSIKALKDISELHIIARRSKFQTGGNQAIKFYQDNCTNLEFVLLERYRFIAYFFRKIIGLFKRILGKPIDPIDLNFVNYLDAWYIIRYAKKNRIKIIWFSFGNISFKLIRIVKILNPELKLVCDTDSVWSRFILRELPYEANIHRRKEIEAEGIRKQIEELEWVKICDITTAVSEVDADYYKGLTEFSDKVMPFSNVIDLSTYSISQLPPEEFNKPSIFLAGTFYHNSPMDKAARWFIGQVFHLVKKQIPNVHLYIIGIGSDSTLYDINDNSITITGLLDSVLPYLCNSNVSIVPLSFESGTRFKILEAAACGIPIVSTTLGAEGIPVTNEMDILIADTPDDFANGIIRIINDENFAKSLAHECKKLITKKYSIEHLKLEGLSILNKLNQIN